MHVFVDESERSIYLLVATILAPGRLHSVRSLMRTLLMRGERRTHFKKETDPRRRLLLSRLVNHGNITTHVYVSRSSGERARATILRRLVADSLDFGATRLVLESRDPAGNARDRTVIAKTNAREKGLVYDHVHASGEPALWISDAVAWCYGAGGDWRRRVKPLVGDVIRVDGEP